ncbi:MAG: hypothetical protein KF796_18725 [Ramlibacter sp.]|nr:hypothetical protein [Ramlibacter sp.]
MAVRKIPPDPLVGGRVRKTDVRREVITSNYGVTRSYGACPHTNPANQMVCTGGSAMTALLGPDLGDGQRRGSPTTQNSLQPLMGLLNGFGAKKWKAGHLLNAEFGGSGLSDRNLTPLTSAANNAHKVYEGHIKRMLLLCNQIDRAYQDYTHWYGVLYTVNVSAVSYSNAPAVNDMYSYAYSHITLAYGFVKLPKFPAMGAPPHTAPPPPNNHVAVPVLVGPDPRLADLRGVVQPNPAPSANIANWAGGLNAIQFSVEIHNEP